MRLPSRMTPDLARFLGLVIAEGRNAKPHLRFVNSYTAVNDEYQLQQTVRRVMGRWVSNTHRRRPMILPIVIEA